LSFLEDPNFKALESAVREAGEFLLSKWPGGQEERRDLSVRAKADGSLVSAADMGSNEILITAISRLFPADLVISEEVESDPQVVRAAVRAWIVDPLDGTKAFLEGRDDFSVLVGLAVEKAPYAGIMCFPARGQMFRAHRGHGAFRDGQPLRVSSSRFPRAGKVYARNCSLKDRELESPFMDSGCAFSMVASGELDGVVLRMTTHREWDLAAPMSVMLEAGATITDERGAPVAIGVGDITFQYLVASNGLVHEALLAQISQ